MDSQSLRDPRDRKAFVESIKAKGHESRVAERAKSNELLRAQPSLESLTRNPEWDLYLSCCQFFLEKAEKDKIAIDTSITDGDVFEPVALVRMKAQSLCLGERIFTLHQLMNLPKQLIEGGEEVLQELMKEAEQEERRRE